MIPLRGQISFDAHGLPSSAHFPIQLRTAES